MMEGSGRNLVLPTFIGGAVVVLGLTLAAIVAHGPYTHANLNLGFDPGYARTVQIRVGPPVPEAGSLPAAPASDPVSLGHQLFVSEGCAACHGLDGRGGVIGPSIVGSKAAKLRVETTVGPKGMPPYAAGALTDQDLAAIAAYLAAMAK